MTGFPLAKGIKSLSAMDYDEVSLVDVPANQHAAVMIAKNYEGATMTAPADLEIFDPETGDALTEDDLETGDIVHDADGNAFEYTAPEDIEDEDFELVGKSAYSGAMRAGMGARRAAGGPGRAVREFRTGSSIGRQMGRSSRQATGAGRTQRLADGLEGKSRARRAGARAGFYSNTTSGGRKALHGAAAAGGVAAVGGGAYEADRHIGKSFASEISKALEDASSQGEMHEIIKAFAEEYDGMQAEMDELASIAKRERDTRLEGQYVEVAKSLGLPGDPEVLGPVLKRMSDVMDPADVEVIAKTLDAASGVIFNELGYDGYGPEMGDPSMADAEAAAERRIAKSGGEPISKAAGIENYYSENPDAYDEYMASRR